jgi:hypothetical protein
LLRKNLRVISAKMMSRFSRQKMNAPLGGLEGRRRRRRRRRDGVDMG